MKVHLMWSIGLLFGIDAARSPGQAKSRSTQVPKGRKSIATGVSPWVKRPRAISPEGAEDDAAWHFRGFARAGHHSMMFVRPPGGDVGGALPQGLKALATTARPPGEK